MSHAELDFGFVIVRIPGPNTSALAAHLFGHGQPATVREAKRQLAEVAEWIEALRDSSGAGRAAATTGLPGEVRRMGNEQQGMIEQEPGRKSQARLDGGAASDEQRD